MYLLYSCILETPIPLRFLCFFNSLITLVYYFYVFFVYSVLHLSVPNIPTHKHREMLQGTKLPAYKQAYPCEFRGLQHHKFIRDSPVRYMDHDRLRFSSDGTYNIVMP